MYDHKIEAEKCGHTTDKYRKNDISSYVDYHVVGNTLYAKVSNTLKDFYKTNKNPMFGKHHTSETRKKISENHNPNIYTKERAEKISFANRGKPKSEEHKRKLSECAKQRTGEKNPFYGKHHTKETIMNNSVAHRKYVFIQIDLVTGTELNRFNSIQDVCKYISANNLSKAKESSIAYRIYTTIYGNQSSAYGYGWIGEKCNDYPNRE